MNDDIEWMNRGRCRHSKTPDIFFPKQRGKNVRQKHSREAKAICAECPVVNNCLLYAIEHSMPGIWGGTLDEERQPREVAA